MNKITFSTPQHKTNVLPLRWIVNGLFHTASMYFFSKSLDIYFRDEDGIVPMTPKLERKMDLYHKIYKILDKPYDKFGTTYLLNRAFIEEMTEYMSGCGWDDYDEEGVPYWAYHWHEDPLTGDAWRIVKRG